MTSHPSSFATFSDHDLLATAIALADGERNATATLIAALAEVDARRLYLGEGCSSLFTYCMHVLHLSEHAAYGGIEAARAARRFPIVLDLLANGSITLTTVTLLSAHLTEENVHQVLTAAAHESRREVEHLVATLRPQPDAPTTIRKLPTRAPSSPTSVLLSASSSDSPPSNSPAPSTPSPCSQRPAVVAPLAPERYKIQFIVSRELHDKLRAVQGLMRHSIPDGDVASIFDKALTLLLADIRKSKCAAASRPRPVVTPHSRSRHIPAAVRREVWSRDAGQCAFVGTQGRCTERGFLEFHHVTPYAAGGLAVSLNIELRCRQHNVFEAGLFFGDREDVREPDCS